MTSPYSELTDSQWPTITVFFGVDRKRNVSLQAAVNPILPSLRTGCQWCNPPDYFPKWRVGYYYFDRRNKDGTMDALNLAGNKMERKKKEALPSLLCIDSQSVKLATMIFEHRGMDGTKKINRRKRQLMADVGEGYLRWRFMQPTYTMVQKPWCCCPDALPTKAD